jgi:hypothetical protein
LGGLKDLFHLKKQEDSDGSLDYYVCKKHPEAIVLFKVQCPFCGTEQVQKRPPAKASERMQEVQAIRKLPPEHPKIEPPPEEEQIVPRSLENTISLKMTPPRKRYARKKEVAVAPPPPAKAKPRARKLILEKDR